MKPTIRGVFIVILILIAISIALSIGFSIITALIFTIPSPITISTSNPSPAIIPSPVVHPTTSCVEETGCSDY